MKSYLFSVIFILIRRIIAGVVSITENNAILESKLRNLPAKPGVYQFKDISSQILYVGKAINLRNRVHQYFSKRNEASPRLETMVGKIADLEVIVTDSEVEALILEATLIKQLKPRYNVDLKDDKSYPYIVVTNEPLPRVFVTRRIIRDGSKYFGPYTDVKSMRSSLKMVREIFKVRSCNYFIDDEAVRKRKYKVCLDYHIKKCEGPCEGLVSREKYNGMINEVVQVLKGKTSTLVNDLDTQMRKASEELRFEEAAELRDRIKNLSVYNERQKVVDTEMVDRDLFAVVLDGNDACGVIFNVRDGKIVGRKYRYMSGVEEKTESEVIEQLLEQYYLDVEDYPTEVFLTQEIENQDIIQRWLTQKKGQTVQVIVPKIGEKAKLMTMCRSNALILLKELKLQKEKRKDYIPHSVIALQRDLRLVKPPRRIECFDISNIQGTDSVASMVVFIDGRPKKSEYRKFKLHTVQGPDDFASIREVIQRRYSQILDEENKPPDLIVVDGGKGQLTSAVAILVQLGLRKHSLEYQGQQSEQSKSHAQIFSLPVVGLAKRLEEVFIPESNDPLTLPKTSSGLKLLQHIRNEAHRFAVAYHRSLRRKRTLQTELDLIKGVGQKRAKELLEVFGSVQGVKFATKEQLTAVVGGKIALKIGDYFSDSEHETK